MKIIIKKTNAVPAVEHIVDQYHKDPPMDFRELPNAETWYQIVRLALKQNMKMNVENIFDQSESKIESFDNDLKFFLLFFTILYRIFPFKHAYHLSMQSTFKDVKIDKKNIRPDAYVWVPSNPDFRLIIECDGFKYHSDKESFTKDRARDRVLQRKGFTVLRFFGHEIYHDPIGKSLELLDYLLESTDLSLFEGKD